MCQSVLDAFYRISDTINLPIAKHKTEGPTMHLMYLGMGLDTVKKIIIVPADKLQEAEAKIHQILQSKKILVKQLLSLTGLLNFLCKAVHLGRAFLRQLYDRSAGLPKHYHISVTKDVKEDLQMWLKFLHSFLCLRPFPKPAPLGQFFQRL